MRKTLYRIWLRLFPWIGTESRWVTVDTVGGQELQMLGEDQVHAFTGRKRWQAFGVPWLPFTRIMRVRTKGLWAP